MTDNWKLKQKEQHGFTLLEVLLVLGLGVFLTSLVLPVGLRFYQLQVTDETTADLVAHLRETESGARSGKNQHPYGIKFFSDRYVVYEGSQYGSRATGGDEIFFFPPGTTLATSSDEVTFAAVTGMPNTTATYNISLYGKTATVTVNEIGIISQL